MFKEVDVVIDNNIRKPEYEGNYTLIEDKGNTMIIEVEGNLEEQNRADIDYIAIMIGVDL